MLLSSAAGSTHTRVVEQRRRQCDSEGASPSVGPSAATLLAPAHVCFEGATEASRPAALHVQHDGIGRWAAIEERAPDVLD